MKGILIIAHSLMDGGVEHFIIDLCKNINRNRFKVCLLVLSDNRTDLISQIPPDVNYQILQNKFIGQGLRDTLSLFRNVLKIVHSVINFSPDVVHTNTFQTNLTPILMAIAIARRGRSIKHVHTIHTAGMHYESVSFRSKLKLKYEMLCYRLMHSNIVCLTKCLSSRIPNCNGVTKRVIYNGVNAQEFKKISPGRSKNILTMVYTARFDHGKSHDTLIDAFKILSNKFCNIRLLLIGDGILRNSIESKVQDLKLSTMVTFKGNVKREDIPQLLVDSNIGVFPSEFEGFSIALLEMMAAGLPIVCADIPVFREVFDEYTGSLFFPSRNSKILAEQLELLIENPDLREELGQLSIKIASKFSYEKCVVDYEQLYDEP